MLIEQLTKRLGTNTGLRGAPLRPRPASAGPSWDPAGSPEPGTRRALGPPAGGPRAPSRSASAWRREAWPALEPAAAAMASVVEYKGLKAGYHCGYCASREGKTSCGECPAVRVAVTASRQALATSRRVPGGGLRSLVTRLQLPGLIRVCPTCRLLPGRVFPPRPHQ